MQFFQHPAYAFLFQVIVWLFSGDWLAGAMFGIAFFLGREHAQAEYRVIQQYYEGKRANMPWYGGFEPRAWNVKSILDFVLPIVATMVAVVIISTTVSAQ